MIKILVSVKNRLSMTKKCVEAIVKHTSLPYQLYIYDGTPTYKVKEHFEFAQELYEKEIVTQYTFTTRTGNFNAFDKAVNIHQFGKLHQLDPDWNKTEYLLILDNDMLVAPDYDKTFLNAWNEVKSRKMWNIKVITQKPGGIVNKRDIGEFINLRNCVTGVYGGSGLWCVQNNFFNDVGFLDIQNLIGKRGDDDIRYWQLLAKASKGQDYILGLNKVLSLHCGGFVGSVCNILRFSSDPNKEEIIKFPKEEEFVESMSFSEFYNKMYKESSTKIW